MASGMSAFTKAADELLSRTAAISRQAPPAGRWFGVKLFRRVKSSQLTPPGHIYYRGSHRRFLGAGWVTSMNPSSKARLRCCDQRAATTFTTVMAGSVAFLVPAASPGCAGTANDLNCSGSASKIRASTSLSGKCGDPPATAGGHSISRRNRSPRFVTSTCCPPALKEAVDLKHYTLITHLHGALPWSQWFAQAGTEMDVAQETRRFEQMFFALQATQERLGIGLFRLFPGGRRADERRALLAVRRSWPAKTRVPVILAGRE